MTPGGLCFQCREYTGRYDNERKRWACRGCSPELLPWERELAEVAAGPAPATPFNREHQVHELRDLGLGRRDLETVSEKLRAELREHAEHRRASQPWRHRGRR